MNLPGIDEPVAASVFVGALAVRHLAQLWLARGKARGARSGWTSTSLLFIAYVTAMLLAFGRVASGRSPVAALAAGGILWLVAVLFRMWALAHLAEQFSSLIEIRDRHRLVDTGPYSLVRHPLHLAFGLEVDAMALVAFSWWGVAPGVLVWLVIIMRNRTEEAALAAHFGAAYEDYRARVPAMDLVRGAVRRLRGGGS